MKRWRNALFAVMALGLFLAGVGVARLKLWGPQAVPASKRDRGQSMGRAPASRMVAIDKDRAITLPLSIREKIGLQEDPVEFRPIEEVMTFNGMIVSHPDRTVAISPRIEGKIVSAWGLAGSPVEKDEKLVEIHSLELERLETDLIQGWNRLGLADADRDLARELAARKAIALKDLLKKEMEQRQAAREVEGLRARLRLIGIAEGEIDQMKSTSRATSSLVLRAPIAGVIVERNVVLGETVSSEKTLFRLADLRRVLAEGEAFESQARLLRRGLPVRITVAALPDRKYEGRITNIGAAVDPEKRTIRFLAEIENPPEAPLRPNMFARMTVVTGRQSKVLAIPLAAIIGGGGEEVVFVAASDGYERRPVSLGHRDDRYAEVKHGLARGERVVTTGKRQLEALYRKGAEERPGGASRGESEDEID
ncbi:MAG: efflux RND transporter periplasmic adaptor subunit [candidate division NC10 bacterium]|nr:efflux RND transporter periplasmic adaptor subunit [candidate division NC10 bacterium]